MNKILTIALFFTISVSLCYTQTTGLLLSDERYMSIPVLPSYSGTKYNEVPIRVSLRKYCPVPGDQQQMGSCVGWAVGFGAYTIMQAQSQSLSDAAIITQKAHSAAFIYNQIKLDSKDCTAGAYIEDALELLKTTGDCLEQSFNYKKVDCTTIPSKTYLEEAERYRIADYATVFSINEPPKTKVAKACKVLATQTPIVVGIGITSDFLEIPPGTRIWQPAQNNTPISYHAMVLVGYDNVEKEFELMNSFGTSWGNNGFIKIKYEDFEQLCRYAYIMLPDVGNQFAENTASKNLTPTNPLEELTGSFAFRKPAGYLNTSDGEEIPFFEEVNTRWNSQERIYNTKTPYFEVGEIFQLVAREIPRGKYAYVFSKSNTSDVKLHFPKQFRNDRIAGFVLEKTVEIIIPSEETALQLVEPGIDYLCIVYSSVAINDIEERLKKINPDITYFPSHVRSAFSDIIISDDQVRFSENTMSFSARSNKSDNEIAVCLILKVIAK